MAQSATARKAAAAERTRLEGNLRANVTRMSKRGESPEKIQAYRQAEQARINKLVEQKGKTTQQKVIAADKTQAEQRKRAGAVGASSQATKQEEAAKVALSQGATIDPKTGGFIHKRKVSDSVSVSDSEPKTKGGSKTVKVKVSDSVNVSEPVTEKPEPKGPQYTPPKEDIESIKFNVQAGSQQVEAQYILKEKKELGNLESNKIYPWIKSEPNKPVKPYVFGEATLLALKEAGYSLTSPTPSPWLNMQLAYLNPDTFKKLDEAQSKIYGDRTTVFSSSIEQGMRGEIPSGTGRGAAFDTESAIATGLIFVLPLKGRLPIRGVPFGDSQVLVIGTQKHLKALATISGGKITKGFDTGKIGGELKKIVPQLKEKTERPTELSFLGKSQEALILQEKNLDKLFKAGVFEREGYNLIKAGKTVILESKGLPEKTFRKEFPEQITKNIPKGKATDTTKEFLREEKITLQGSSTDLFANIKQYQVLPADLDIVTTKAKQGAQLAQRFEAKTGEAFKEAGIKLKVKTTAKGSASVEGIDQGGQQFKIIEFVYKGEFGGEMGQQIAKTKSVMGVKTPTKTFEVEGVKIRSGRFQTHRMIASITGLELKGGKLEVSPPTHRVKDFPKAFGRAKTEQQIAKDVYELGKESKLGEAAATIKTIGSKKIDFDEFFKKRRVIEQEEVKTLEGIKEPSTIDELKDIAVKNSLGTVTPTQAVKEITKPKTNEIKGISKKELSPAPKKIKEVSSISRLSYETPKPGLISRPSVPSRPSESTRPSAPSRPSVPSRPSTPSMPSRPSVPSRPSEPTRPSAPSRPSVPSRPSTPSMPSRPSVPSRPSEPTRPSAPSRPSVPSRSNIRGVPIRPTRKAAALVIPWTTTRRKPKPNKIPERKEFIGSTHLTRVEGFRTKKRDISYRKPEQKAFRDIEDANKKLKLRFKTGKVKLKW